MSIRRGEVHEVVSFYGFLEVPTDAVRVCIGPVCDCMAKALGGEWPEYRTAEDAWNEFADLSPLWTGIRYDRIEEVGLQWPCTDRDHPGTPFLHAPSPSRPSGKGKFYPVEYQPPIEQPDSEYPFVLSTGRTLYHYNSATMTMSAGQTIEIYKDRKSTRLNSSH